MTKRSSRVAAGILAGAVAVAVVTWVRLELTPIAGSDMALTLYILAVLLAAGIGGAIAGLTTIVLSLSAGIAVIVGTQSLTTSAAEWLRVVIFILEGVAISFTIDQLQKRTVRLRQVTRDLEDEHRLVERMALEDVLTGLGNRRAFERDLERALAQAYRDGTPLTVAIADIDGLKHTNDEHGHEIGDSLLVAVAAALHEGCRESDEAYRLGGDEFALLLPDTDGEEYHSLAARLADLLRQVGSDFHDTGVSIGAAHAPVDGEDARTLVRLADSRMYAVKLASHAMAGRPTNGST